MAYIGKEPANLGQATSEDTFTATAGQTVFTLTADVGIKSDIIISINGVVQAGTAYGVSGTGGRTLTFTSGVTLNDVVRVAHIGYKPSTYVPAADGINSSHIQDNAIDSEHYTDGSIDAAHLAANSVDSDSYVDGSIDAAHLSANSVDSDAYVDGSIDLAHMSVNSIDSDQYVDGSIDLAHMSVNSIDSDQYVDGSIDLAHLSADCVDGTKIADNAIDSEHYTDGSIDNAHIADDAIDSEHYADGSIDEAHIAADAVNFATHLKAGTDGELITWDASGDPAAVAVGTSGHELTSGGAGVAPTFQASHSATAGKHTIWVPALAMFGSDTNGADLQTVETTATRPDLKVLDFDSGTREHAQFSVAFPKSWNLGTVTFKPFWSPGNTNTSNCIWALQGIAVSDNDTADVAYGTAQTSTDAGIGTIEDVQVGPESAAITIGGSPADADLCFFQVYRDAASGSDGFTGDARLLGIKLFFTTDAENDA